MASKELETFAQFEKYYDAGARTRFSSTLTANDTGENLESLGELYCPTERGLSVRHAG